MEVKVWSYLKELESEKSEILASISKVLDSGVLILGKQGQEFEENFANYCNVKFGIGVNSATDALFFALRALDIKKGDEVITVSNTAVPTVSAISATGATVKFVDIDPRTYLMNLDLLEKEINLKTKCIIAVHLFGQCLDFNKLEYISNKYKIPIIEDCAQSHGAKNNNKIAGSFGILSAFSFYPTKILGGYGDAGMVLTNDESLRDKIKRLRFYGMEKTYYSLEQGYNSRLDEIHAAILNYKFKNIDTYISKRRILAARYDELLSKADLILPSVSENNYHSYYLYVVRHIKRDFIIDELKKKEIFLNISYPWPIHTMPGYTHLNYKNGDLPETEKAANEIFSLPMYPSLTFEEQDYVINSLINILNLIK